MSDPDRHSDPRRTERRHAHPTPGTPADYDVIVVGAGHAGIEAALAAARLGARVGLITFRRDKIGEMSCNPAIGGLGKGQLVREIDALGGAMAEIADATGIQFRMLNTKKGAAVQAPRAQSDRHRYRETATARVLSTPGVEVLEAAAEGLVVVDGEGRHLGRRQTPWVRGVRLGDGTVLDAHAVVLTTGTFLSAVMHTGEEQAKGGRVGEASADGLGGDLTRLGLELGRLKTGTPPRLVRDSIHWDELEAQPGDVRPQPFSFATDPASFPSLEQVDCHITWTNERTHALIRDNIHRAPMYAGRIHGVGPRYCPSVEDKVMRFADRDRHQIFLEPESLRDESIYVNGVSTSLPAEIQEAFVHTVSGLENARFLRHGYAVEYDFVLPAQLSDTLACHSVPGLFLAGQINGTSGYEEAAAQGLVAGANAALWVVGSAPFVLGRAQAYVGVLVDDLTVSHPSEPYRMFTSRAEYRLLLRQDNADRRLVPLAAAVGLVDRAVLERTQAKERRIRSAVELLEALRSPADGHKTVAELLRRPETQLAELALRFDEVLALELDPESMAAVEIEIKYAGYLQRERDQVARLERQELVEIPSDLDFATLKGMANEAREKLARARPRTLGAAARVAGVRPPDVALLAVHVERHRRTHEPSV